MARPALWTSLAWRFIAVAAIPLAFLAAANLFLETSEIKRDVEAESRLIARSIAQDIRSTLHEPAAVVGQLAAQMDAGTLGQHEIEAAFQAAIGASSVIETLQWVGEDGIIQWAVTRPGGSHGHGERRGQDISGTRLFQEVVAAGSPAWSDTMLHLEDDHHSLAHAVPLDGGILVADFHLEHTEEWGLLTHPAEGIVTVVVDRSGTTVFHTDPRLAGEHVELLDRPPIQAGLRERRQGFFIYEDHGEQHLGATALVPEVGWLVMVVREADEAYALLRRTQAVLLAVLLAGMLLAVLLSRSLARRLAQPLNQLAMGAQAIAGGGHGAALPPQRYRETEQLAQSMREMAAAVQERERRFSALAQTAPVGIYQADREGGLIYANPAMLALAGATAAEMQGFGWANAIHPEDLARVKSEWGKHVAGEKPLDIEFRYQHPDGTVTTVTAQAVAEREEDGAVAGHIGTVTDITERKRIEEELRRSERRFRDLVANIPGAVYRCAFDPGWTMQYLSEGIEEITGYAPGELVGSQVLSYNDLIHPEEQGRVRAEVERQVLAGEAFTIEYRVLHRDGEVRWVYERGQGIHDEQGHLLHLHGAFFDVTEAHRAQETVKQLEEQLLHAQRLEAIGQLAGGVAHDFNNLLQAIQGNVAFALEDLPADHATRGDLEEAMRAGDRAAALTRQLLAFSRRQVLQPEPIDLDDLITNLLKMLRRLIGENIELRFDAGTGLRPVLADPGQIEQVVMNLVVNARDAMPDGGRVTIETRRIAPGDTGYRAHDDIETEPQALLTISDTGTGMDPETTQRIFEPFFTTKEVGRGTGLGLATVYGIVRQHRGLITVDSQEGQGTTFRVYLPFTKSAGAGAAQPPEAAEGWGGDETVLIAEDDHTVREIGVRLLERAGYRVLQAENGQEAVRLFRAHREEIGLVILDHIMPVMGGEEAQREIEREQPDARFLICTGYSPESSGPRSLMARNDGVRTLQKPYRREELLRAVRETLDGRGI